MTSSAIPTGKVEAFTLRVDEQRMHVSLVISAPQFLSAEQVLAQMTSKNIVVTEAAQQRITDMVAHARSLTEPPPPAIVSEGKPPQSGRNGQVVWEPRHTQALAETAAAADGSVDHYASRLITVHAGEVLARIMPPQPGVPGRDVFDHEVPARAGVPAKLALGSGCHLADDGTLVADVEGTLNVNGDRVSVSEGLHIQNVDFKTGHVSAPRDLCVDGQVADLFRVVAGGNAEIGGDVLAADVQAAGDITLRGALVNHRKGRCLAGRNLSLRLADNSCAAARGNILVSREAINCDLFSGGKIDGRSGSLTGGTLVATGGITARSLGAAGGSRTLVVVGTDWMLPLLTRPLLEQADAIAKKLKQEQPDIELLRANLHRLTPGQRETLTELDFAFQERAGQRDLLLANVNAMRAERQATCKAEIEVAKELHAGVELRLNGRRTVLEKPLHGPLVILLTQIADEPTIVVKLTASGNTLTLPSTLMEDPLEGIPLPPLPPEPAPEAT